MAIIYGTSGDDTLSGSDTADSIYGLGGVDQLYGKAGDDILDGGDGKDDLWGMDGADRLWGGEGDDVLWGGADGDYLFGMDGWDFLYGGDGNDFLYGAAGLDLMAGNAGDDTYQIDDFDDTTVESNDYISEDPNEGVDTVISSLWSYTLPANVEKLKLAFGDIDGTGNELDNVILGSEGKNHLSGGEGNDTLDGRAGDDTLDGGEGDDVLWGGEGNDLLRGDDGADFFFGDAGDDTLFGGAGDDYLVGGDGADALYGDAGNDDLNGAEGADTLAGGTGDDGYGVTEGDQVIELANEGNDSVIAFVTYTLGENVENLVLAFGDIDGTGNALDNDIRGSDDGANRLSGGEGNDTILGLAGDDTLDGGEGNDSLDGGAGADTLAGGAGNDVYTISNLGDIAFERPDEGVDTVISQMTYTLDPNVENLWLMHGDIDGTGNELDNDIRGADGMNRLSGAEGNDTLAGFVGDDTIDGGEGDDSAVYALASNGYKVTHAGSNWGVIDKSQVEGNDALISIEQLQFADKSFELVNPPRTAPPVYNTDKGFLFDAVFYLLDNPELVPTQNVSTALAHYFATGAAQGKAPTSWFDATWYENRWPDLTPYQFDDATLFMHYNLYGVWEGRSAGPEFDQFDGNRYLTDNPDVAAYVDSHLPDFLGSRSNGAIAHYVIYGQHEQRLAYDLVGQQIDLGYTVDLGG